MFLVPEIDRDTNRRGDFHAPSSPGLRVEHRPVGRGFGLEYDNRPAGPHCCKRKGLCRAEARPVQCQDYICTRHDGLGVVNQQACRQAPFFGVCECTPGHLNSIVRKHSEDYFFGT